MLEVCWTDRRWSWKKTFHCVVFFSFFTYCVCELVAYSKKNLDKIFFKSKQKQDSSNWINSSPTLFTVECGRSSRPPLFRENVGDVVCQSPKYIFPLTSPGWFRGRWNSWSANEDSNRDWKFDEVMYRPRCYDMTPWGSPFCKSLLQMLTRFPS